MPNLHIKKRDLCCLTILPYIYDINKKAVMDAPFTAFLFIALVASSFEYQWL
ncbi:hypothetical protein VCRA2110O318_240048 [Vibrio crassostreae]|nr:hypothetical protein VCRA2117O328_170046 [Vibrio crassostreae]CAK2306184.1 hypothetical protein VCRA2110O318_240048 [Vibrio crassostreae]CAK2422353.1 hypothetical protein VCRA2110O319_170045 [Vibrio crassostreae]CAK2684236.1 hypothetical protein VCRA217O317_180045 [Vibrio crassostreae]